MRVFKVFEDMIFCTSRADLELKAVDLTRDLLLALRHSWTLPFILGSPRWLLWSRYKHSRPYSELNFLLFPYELTRIVVQALLTAGFIIPLLFTIGLSILLHKVRIRRPLYIMIYFLPIFFRAHIISVASPVDKPSTPAHERVSDKKKDIRNVRALLHDGKLFINRTSDCPMEGQEEVWFYVNGVAEQGAMVAATCTLLRKLTGRLVNPFVNTSHGIPLDIMECIVGRSLNCASEPAFTLVSAVIRQLAKGRRVVLVAHSQGGIICSNVVNYLVKCAKEAAPNSKSNNINGNATTDRSLLRTGFELHPYHKDAFADGLARLEVYTFASAADESQSIPSGPFAEHFATEDDFISRIGVLEFSKKHKKYREWNGTVYKLDAKHEFQGHLVKEMILPAMKKGLFANDSVFWRKYCSKNHNMHVAVDHHRVEIIVPDENKY